MAILDATDEVKPREVRSYPIANALEQELQVALGVGFIGVVREGAALVLLAHVDPRARMETVIVHLRKPGDRFEHQGTLEHAGAVPQTKLQAFAERGLSEEQLVRRRAKRPKSSAF